MEIGESTEEAVIREAWEETGLADRSCGSGRHLFRSRSRSSGACGLSRYFSRGSGQLVSGSDARSAKVFPLEDLPRLAFDHHIMIRDALGLYCTN